MKNPVEFLMYYREHSEEFLPMIDHHKHSFPPCDEGGVKNIGWSCGMLKDRPYFAECWTIDGMTVLTFFVSVIGIEDYTAEKFDVLFEENNIFTKKADAQETTIRKLIDKSGNCFFSVNVIVGLPDEESCFERDNTSIYSYSILDKLNNSNEESKESDAEEGCESEKFEIKIIEGHDYGSYFWFQPVSVEKKDPVLWEEIISSEDEISIEEGNIECFLEYFLRKYFDKELFYNRYRYDDMEYTTEFEWYLTDNFYTYECMRKMLQEISKAADLLETDYGNEELKDIKKEFSIFYMCSCHHSDYIERKNENIENHKDVVIDFYRRFVSRMSRMMEEHPETDLISVMGP